MRLSDYCKPKAVLPDLEVVDKEDAIRQLVSALVSARVIKKPLSSKILDEILAREGQATTGIGHGVGIPHARSEHVEKVVMAMGRVDEGVDFGAVDGERVRIILLLISPKAKNDEHLAAMKAIVKIVRDPYQCKRLHGCRSPESFLDLIGELDGTPAK